MNLDINPELIISTGCCQDAEKHKVVRLYFPWERDNNDESINRIPKWCSYGINYDKQLGWIKTYVEVSNCPFCGKSVPKIEINEDSNKYKIQNSDGDYCQTCHERLCECICSPPEFRWKPVGIDIKIPTNIKHKKSW